MTSPRIPIQSRRGLRILPSATTVLAICAGLTSIKFALDGRPHVALALIGAAAVLDGIDGGIARALHAQSPMGAEIDSLADAVNFGVAPALVVYVTLLPHSPVGWIFVLLYAVCIVLRLARFNALLDDDTRPAYTREYFVGMPAPCGAVGAIGPLAAMLQFGQGWWTSTGFICAWLAANTMVLPNSALMGSRRPWVSRVSQNRRLVGSEKNFFSKLFCLKCCSLLCSPCAASLIATAA